MKKILLVVFLLTLMPLAMAESIRSNDLNVVKIHYPNGYDLAENIKSRLNFNYNDNTGNVAVTVIGRTSEDESLNIRLRAKLKNVRPLQDPDIIYMDGKINHMTIKKGREVTRFNNVNLHIYTWSAHWTIVRFYGNGINGVIIFNH